MCKPVNWIIKNAQAIISIGSVIIAIFAWLFVVNGLPARVDNVERRATTLEKDVAELKTSIATQNTKTDLLLQAVYEVRAVLMKGK